MHNSNYKILIRQ